MRLLDLQERTVRSHSPRMGALPGYRACRECSCLENCRGGPRLPESKRRTARQRTALNLRSALYPCCGRLPPLLVSYEQR